MDDRRLAAALADVGALVRFPDLADARPGVLRLIARPRRRPWWRALVAPRYRAASAAVAVVLALAALLALSPAARAVAEEILRLPGVVIFRGAVPTSTPSPTPGVTPSPTPSIRSSLGDRVSLEEAVRLAGHPLLVPTDPVLGAPDEVYVRRIGPVTAVSLLYVTRPGVTTSPEAGVAALVTELDDARIDAAIFGKIIGPGTTVVPVTVNGGQGYWLEGQPHEFFYQQRDGQDFVSEPLRLAGNTLLWEQNGLLLRLEAEVDEATALRIAASVR